jgi:hypothetical protein
MSMKNSDTIGNRSRDLPVCSSVPQSLQHRVPQVSTYNAKLKLVRIAKFGRGKAISIINSECVSVALVIQHS